MLRPTTPRLCAPVRFIALLLLPGLCACGPASKQDAKTAQQTEALPKAPPPEIWTQFQGNRALADVQKQVECGARPAGSPELAKARALIVSTLEAAGWTPEIQEFTAETPHGHKQIGNVIGRFSREKGKPADRSAQKAIVASHFDTKYFSTINFVGANDGASSTGALLELARVLALDPALAAQIELVFFDGEEAVQQFTETDGLYGSRYYSQQLRESGRFSQFRFGLLWDMIGDKSLTVTLPLDSPKELAQGILASAEALQSRKAFRIFDRPMLDDHVPLNQIARIPTLDIIDFEYEAWHTADDTLNQLSPDSLQTIGMVTLHYLKHALP